MKEIATSIATESQRPKKGARGRLATLGLVAVAVAGPVAALPAAAAAPARAVTAAGHNPSARFAVIRGAHFSPNTPGVDVYLRSFSGKSKTLWLSDLGYGDVSGYRRVAPGFYTVSMRTHGAPASSPAGLSWTLHARAGKAYTVAAAGMNKHLRGIVLRDRLSSPKPGTGLVRVIQAANRAPHARLIARPHTVIAANAKFASTTKYATVPAGHWKVRVSQLPSSRLTASKSVHIQSSSVDSLVVLDSKTRGIELRVLHDASGAQTAPAGSVDAGGGGMAPNPRLQPSSSRYAVALAALLVLGAGYLCRPRHTQR